MSERKGNSLECPQCGCPDCRALYTRVHKFIWRKKKKSQLRRRRACRNCGYRFNTVEAIEEAKGVPENPPIEEREKLPPTYASPEKTPENPYLPKD